MGEVVDVIAEYGDVGLTQANVSEQSNVSLYGVRPPAGPPFMTLSETEERLIDIHYALDHFGVPTILAIGIISNLLLAVTVRNSELKKVSICSYFFSMGLVDTMYLIAMAIPWASARLVDIYNREGFCQLVYYLNLLTTFLSSWYIVMMLFERAAVAFFPDKARKMCNAFRTKCYITVLSIFSIVGHLYLTWTSGVYVIRNMQICTVIPENRKDIVVVRKVDIVFSFILPITLCSALVISLLIHLCAFYFPCKEELITMTTERMTFEVRIHTPTVRKYTANSANDTAAAKVLKVRLQEFSRGKRLTVVSLIIAFVYITLCLPHNVIKSKITFLNGAYNFTNQDRLFLLLFEELYKINFAYKGIIYFCLIPEMRINFMKLCFAWYNFIFHSRVEKKSEVSRV